MAATSSDIHHLRRERERRAWLTSKVSIMSRAVTYGARLVVIPLSLKLLGNEQYGLWLTIGSLVAWLSMSDFGFSQGLINAIAEASGQDDQLAIRRLVSSGFALFAVLSSILGFFVIWGSSWSLLYRLVGVEGNPGLTRDAHLLILICGLFFAASLLFRGIDAVCQGLQEGYVSAWFGIGSTILNLGAVAFLYWQGGTLGMYAVAMAAPPVFATLVLGIYLFAVRHREFRPSLRYLDRSAFRTLFHFGGPLFVLQLSYLAMLYSVNLLIASRLGPAQVPRYAVPYALFAIVVGACFSLSQPYIPAYAEASSRGDFAWVRRRAVRTLAVTVGIMAAVSAVFTGIGRWLIQWWAGPSVVPRFGFLLVMSLFAILRVANDTDGTLLIGLGRVWAKAALQSVEAAIFIVGAWLMLPSMGLTGIPLAGVLALAADPIVSLPYSFSYMKREAVKFVAAFQPQAVTLDAD